MHEQAMPIARIVLVEDEGIIALDLRRSLEKLGYAVLGQAADGRPPSRSRGNYIPTCC